MTKKVLKLLTSKNIKILFFFFIFFYFSQKTVTAKPPKNYYRCYEAVPGVCSFEHNCDPLCSFNCPSDCPGWDRQFQCDCPTDPLFGEVNPPPGVSEYSGGALAGLKDFINNIIKIIIVIAGIYALFNLTIAGYSFMSAGGDPKKIADAWAKIWQTLIGLAVAVGSFTLAAIFGKLIFGEWNALIQLRVFGP
jgi:hypothetical protein